MTFSVCISVEKNNVHYLCIFRNNTEFMRHFIPNIQKLKTAKTQDLYVYEIYKDGLEHILAKWVDHDYCGLPAFSLPMPSIYETIEKTVYHWDNPEINEFLLEDYKKRGGAKSQPQSLPYDFKRMVADELSSKELFIITIPELSWLNHKQIHEKMTFQLPLDKTGNVIKKNIINKLTPDHFMLKYDSIIKGCVNPKQVVSKRESLLEKKELLEIQIQNIEKEIEDVDMNTPGKILLESSKSGISGKRRRIEDDDESDTESTYPCYHDSLEDDEGDEEEEDSEEEVVEATPPQSKKRRK
jgi:hypothetical protein